MERICSFKLRPLYPHQKSHERCEEAAPASANRTPDYLGRPVNSLVTPSEPSDLLAKAYGDKNNKLVPRITSNVSFRVVAPSQKLPEQTLTVGQTTDRVRYKFVTGSKQDT